jgi:FkbM family methyltransferase
MLGRYVANHRRSPLVRYLAGKAERLIERYESDSNYDFATNGEAFVLRTLARHPLRCIFDVGANVGDWARIAHEAFPQATIHCFEVMPPTFEELQRNTRDLPRIRANPFGLYEREQTIELNYYPGVSTITTMTDYPHEFERRTATGRVIAGDAYVQEHGIERIDFLKLDVEGAESGVLAGLEKTIGQGRVDIVQFEYGQVSILTKFLLRDFYGFFEKYGYRVGKIYPDYVEFRAYSFKHENFRGANFLAIRDDRPELFAGLA